MVRSPVVPPTVTAWQRDARLGADSAAKSTVCAEHKTPVQERNRIVQASSAPTRPTSSGSSAWPTSRSSNAPSVPRSAPPRTCLRQAEVDAIVARSDTAAVGRADVLREFELYDDKRAERLLAAHSALSTDFDRDRVRRVRPLHSAQDGHRIGRGRRRQRHRQGAAGRALYKHMLQRLGGPADLPAAITAAHDQSDAAMRTSCCATCCRRRAACSARTTPMAAATAAARRRARASSCVTRATRR